MPSATPVREVMTEKVVTLRPDQTFEAAADLLAEHHIGAAPVVDAGGSLVGLLRDEDLIVSEANLHVPTWFTFFGVDVPVPGQQKHFEAELKRMVAATVADLMATDVDTCSPDDMLGEVASKMHDSEITHMPVVDADGKLVGIVARGDIVRRVANNT